MQEHDNIVIAHMIYDLWISKEHMSKYFFPLTVWLSIPVILKLWYVYHWWYMDPSSGTQEVSKNFKTK